MRNKFDSAITVLREREDCYCGPVGSGHQRGCEYLNAINILKVAGKINKKEALDTLELQEIIEVFAWAMKDEVYQQLCDIVEALPDIIEKNNDPT